MNRLSVAILLASLALIAPNSPLRTLCAFAGLGYVATYLLIPRLGASFIRIGLKGRDLSKADKSQVLPESMGLVAAITYLLLMFCLVPFIFFKYLVNVNSEGSERVAENFNQQYEHIKDNNLFPHNRLAAYLSAVLCLQSTALLGFCDDLFDIRWRHKFFLPAFASLPLLIVYYVDFSVTSIVVPLFITKLPFGESFVTVFNFFASYANKIVTLVTGLSFLTLPEFVVSEELPKLLDLGFLYYGYMGAVAIFTPNSINILAGVNGLEVAQLVVLAIVLLTNDACYLLSGSKISAAAHDAHLFSALFLIPFLGVSIALLRHNWFPAKVFVGDTYCYFSGMVFAVVGILGHFSKTLLLFLLPQIVNFVLSVPQLILIVPCPRHRLPRFDAEDGLMYPSFATMPPANNFGRLLVACLLKLKLVAVIRDKNGSISQFSNLTIINLALVLLGPMREDKLCITIVVFQLVLGLGMMVARHTVGPWFFGYDNLSWGVK